MALFVSGVAVVTGGADGIGRALAIEAARRGASVMVGDIVDASATVETIKSFNGNARWMHCDVGVRDDIVALHEATVAHFGRVNVVCSNVSVGRQGALHELPIEEFERIMRINVFGSFWMLETFAGSLIESAKGGGGASILFTGSEHSLGVPPTDTTPFVGQNSAYTMSKHAILGIAAVARRDLAGLGVGAAVLCPGWTLVDNVRMYLASGVDHGEQIFAMAQEPGDVAIEALDGVEAGVYMIPTNPSSRDFVVQTHQEIISAVEALVADYQNRQTLDTERP